MVCKQLTIFSISAFNVLCPHFKRIKKKQREKNKKEIKTQEDKTQFESTKKYTSQLN